MMHRGPARSLRIPFEHREIRHPQRLPAGREVPTILPDLEPQRAERVADDLGTVGAEEDQIIVACTAAREQTLERRIIQELDDRGLQPLAPALTLIDLDIGQSLG